MKAILEFNLPEDQPELNSAIKGKDWKHVCWQMDQYLLKEIKHNTNNSDYDIDLLEEIRDELYSFMYENNTDLYGE
jgi:hypothetical protein